MKIVKLCSHETYFVIHRHNINNNVYLIRLKNITFSRAPLYLGATTELMPQNRNFDTTPCLGSKRTIANDISGHNETVDLMFQENNTPKKQ